MKVDPSLPDGIYYVLGPVGEKSVAAVELAKRYGNTAITVARLTVRRLARDKSEFMHLWGRLAASEWCSELSSLKGVRRLADWWAKHAEELEKSWPMFLIQLLDATAKELTAFRSKSASVVAGRPLGPNPALHLTSSSAVTVCIWRLAARKMHGVWLKSKPIDLARLFY